jgi:6-phosphogluconate dehydrogenase
MVGLGRMGGNMTVRLVRGGHEVVAFDRDPDAVEAAVVAGAEGAASLGELCEQLSAPRVVWLMVPAGDVTETTIRELGGILADGDVIVDGGNSDWRDSLRRAEQLAAGGIRLVDCGTSGGIWGLEGGYCLMVGGAEEAIAVVEPAFLALAAEDGYAHVGAPGAGHFTKMVHNAIEYGMLAAYGEGFELLARSTFALDLERVAGIWRHGSVVRSWLLDLLHDALEKDPSLERVDDWVDDSGEGRWAIQAAMDQEVPAPITALALFARFASRQDEAFSAKVIAALRNEFGGHAIHADGA